MCGAPLGHRTHHIYLYGLYKYNATKNYNSKEHGYWVNLTLDIEQTLKHSSRMRDARLPTVHASVVATTCQGPVCKARGRGSKGARAGAPGMCREGWD